MSFSVQNTNSYLLDKLLLLQIQVYRGMLELRDQRGRRDRLDLQAQRELPLNRFNNYIT